VEAISIDYAIMEKTDRALVLPIDVGWDDVGSYQSLLDASDKDEDGNHIDGEVVLSEVTGSLVKATSRVVAVAGLSDVVVVETPDVVLVVPLERSQEVRDLARRADQG
jgi:mannose-1-phosphate guanylyltransferase